MVGFEVLVAAAPNSVLLHDDVPFSLASEMTGRSAILARGWTREDHRYWRLREQK